MENVHIYVESTTIQRSSFVLRSQLLYVLILDLRRDCKI